MNEKDLKDLTDELRPLAASTADAQAPDRVEATLLSAFRARGRLGIMRQRKTRAAYWLAAAAALLVMLGAGAAWMSRPRRRPPVAIRPEPLIRQAPAVEQPQVANRVPQFAAKQVRRVPRPRVKPKPAAPPEPQEEVATDFMPVDYGSALTPMETAEIVRVRMARSAMARFGLPVNPDRMMEPVKADIVFGHDGIARAVRFVK